INLNETGNKLNIRADVQNGTGATVKSVVLSLTGAVVRNTTESGAPYALFGDTSGDYIQWTPPLGDYTLTGTPYTGSGGSGQAGNALTINFSVVNQTTPVNQPPVADAGEDQTVVDADDNGGESVTLDGSGS